MFPVVPPSQLLIPLTYACGAGLPGGSSTSLVDSYLREQPWLGRARVYCIQGLRP